MGSQLQGVSIRAFAKLDGCSDALVRKGLKQGRLIAFDDGSVDPSLAKTPWREGNRANGGAQGAQDGETKSEPLVSFMEAQRRKENYLARLRQLEFEIKSGRLVDAEAAKKTTFDLARGERDALLNWPARVSPLIAADLGVDQVKLGVALERHVREFLLERSAPEL